MTYLVIILVCVTVVHWRFRQSADDGLATAVFFLLLMPSEVRIELPGSLPQLTGHRVLLLQLMWQWLRSRSEAASPPYLPGLKWLVLVMVCRGISTLNAVDFGPGLKAWLSFVIESSLFYIVMLRGLTDRKTAVKVLWAAVGALVCIAAIATVEKQTGVNLAARYIPGMLDFSNSVSATFRHRILLGYALAMGFPIVLAMKGYADTKFRTYLANAGLLLVPAACYFANSRGPWVGIALAAAMMAFTGGRVMRKRLGWIALLAAIVLITRPGVLDTITALAKQSMTTDSQKGRSASYRLELWRVAHTELSRSSDKFLFGYGGGSLQSMDLGTMFEFGGSAGDIGFTSWDCEYAADLMQYGYVGFLAEILTYLTFSVWAFRSWLRADQTDRMMLGAGCAAILVFLWAMSNVAIFNPQLQFLFWAVVAISTRASLPGWVAVSNPTPQPVSAGEMPDLAPGLVIEN